MIRWTTPPRDPLGLGGVAFDACRVPVDEGVLLRVLRWTPARPVDDLAVVFVAGWVSSVEGWAPLLGALAARRPVYYIESREKRSATIERDALRVDDFSIHRMARDLVAAFSALGLDGASPLLVGSSLGATSLLEALKGRAADACGAFVIGPNTSFHFPFWGRAFVAAPAESFFVLKWIALFYMRHFRVDAAREPEQIARYERTVKAAVPLRIKLSAQALVDYQVWPDLDSIRVPVGVAFASSDTLHQLGDMRRLIAALDDVRLYSCPSNLFMHRPELSISVESFVTELARPA